MHQENYNLKWYSYSYHLWEKCYLKWWNLMNYQMLYWFVMTRDNSRPIKLFSVLAVQFSKVLSMIFHSLVQWFNIMLKHNMKGLTILVIFVSIKQHIHLISKFIFSQNMKEWSMLVISVSIKLLPRVISKLIFSQNMKELSMLVINVISNTIAGVIYVNTLSQDMKVWSMLVINVNIKVHIRLTFQDT